MLAVNFIWLEAAVLGVVFGISLGSAGFVIRSRSQDPKSSEASKYEDKDGVASEDSQKAYSVKLQNVVLTLLTAAGFLVALAQAVLATIFHWIAVTETWIDLTVWVLILLQTIFILREREPVRCFQLALSEFGCFFLSTICQFVRFYDILNGDQSSASGTKVVLDLTKLALGFCGILICISYPRRPVVFQEGRKIDAQWTGTAWSCYTYAWATPLLSMSARGGKLNFDNIPDLDYRTRSSDLYTVFNASSTKGSLFKKLVMSHLPAIVTQYFLTFMDAIFNLAPQFAMYRLLRLLEERDAGVEVARVALFWVLALGVLQLAGGCFVNRMWWCSDTLLHIPVRIQLGALIFAKSMRKKDIKGGALNKKSDNHVGGALIADDIAKQTDPKVDVTEVDESEEMRKTRQGVINLVGVDAKRVADFSGFSNQFFGSICRLIVAGYFLAELVGWQSLLVGAAVQCFFLPINIHYSKKYTEGQDILMKARDSKLAVVNEALSGIRQIKFAALERQWQKKILNARDYELKSLWRTLLADVMLIGLWIAGPTLLSAACIITYALLHGSLEPSVAFTTISLLSRVEATLSYLPELTTHALDAFISMRRISDYLSAPEKGIVTQPGDQVVFENATITWPADEINDETFRLSNINIGFPKGDLSVISGRTGSGKSLLLSSILGEVEVLSGTITVPSTPSPLERNDQGAHRGNWILPNAVAFVPQIPWIENCSFKDNILFGLPYDEQRYQQVISACALEKDLEILTDGDRTEIGPNGINLSGGQCWRLTLCRALYSRAGILVLDDIFSAVDAHVGKHIFERALTGDICKDRTRILVTHHVALCLPETKYEVRLGESGVEYAGPLEEIERSGLLDAILEDDGTIADEDTVETTLDEVNRRMSTTSRRLSKSSSATRDHLQQRSTGLRRPSVSSVHSVAWKDDQPQTPPAKDDAKKFVEDEKVESGQVRWSVYKQYLEACGGFWFWFTVLMMFGGFELLLLGRSWTLRLWTRHDEVHESITSRFTDRFYLQNYLQHANDVYTEVAQNESLTMYISIYLTVSILISVEGTLRYLWVFAGSLKASRIMFESLTFAVLRAPLRWLDTMPVGRVLNRFTADFNTFDANQAYGLSFLLNNILLVIGIVIAGGIVSPYIVICAVALLAVCTRFALYYLSGARETKRLESTSKSPVFEHFTAALLGVSTIRAFEKSDSYIRSMFFKIDRHARTLYYLSLFKRWLGWRLNVIGAVFSCIVASLIVGYKGMDAALGGFALTFTLQYNDAIFWLLRHYTEVELGMNSTERIIEYSEIETESQGGEEVPASWPSQGKMEVENLVVAYAPDLPPVLRRLNFEVKPKERIGVVGRTGAGKSSLTLAIFRFLEATEGTIFVDGLDISKIKLHDLRSRLAIIPQDPVLFSGTVRSNLDPFDERSDMELKDALQRVHLVNSSGDNTNGTVSPGSASAPAAQNTTRNFNPFTSLSSSISEGGQNLSQGQRQLLCLARAIVARPKIMVLDEATSAVDKTTDALIQRSIREEFEDSTLIVIAHRLSTIVDFDRILVLDEGQVVEYESPRGLVEREGGVFRGMVENSGDGEVLMDVIRGRDGEE